MANINFDIIGLHELISPVKFQTAKFPNLGVSQMHFASLQLICACVEFCTSNSQQGVNILGAGAPLISPVKFLSKKDLAVFSGVRVTRSLVL